jgi:hypothetical protein
MGKQYVLIATNNHLETDRTTYPTMDAATHAMCKAYNELKELEGTADDDTCGIYIDVASLTTRDGVNYQWSIHEIQTDDSTTNDNALNGITIPTEQVRRLVDGHYIETEFITERVQDLINMQKSLYNALMGRVDKDDVARNMATCLVSLAASMKIMDIEPNLVQKYISEKGDKHDD